ncbi:Di-trans-poly-cis-decaprenylcistransferase [Auriculariales sp. MPI-PUGE-AT-0066]|nr:Di-trans-poly-cis-decaprenylcistransferase [Auriculariales sp. MPI-PUGE-AT-0066]
MAASTPRSLIEWLILQVKLLIIWFLKAGPMPKHIGFIMDGNRRYSRTKGIPVRDGHSDGFAAMRRVLELCFRLDVKCVSVYAFSIENFKRSQDEVDNIMTLAKEGLEGFCEQDDLLQANGVRLNVIGDRSLLPPDVKEAVLKAETLTRNNSRAILNICFPYTSRHEMTCAIDAAAKGSLPGAELTERDVDFNLFTTQGLSPPVDIFIRSSGVTRLSDFLLWQSCENTQIHFTQTYWPQYGLRELGPVLLDYQRRVWHKRVGFRT